MIRLNQIRVPVDCSEEELKLKIVKKLRMDSGTKFTYNIVRRSIDARKKPQIYYSYIVDVNISDSDHDSIASPEELHIIERVNDPQIVFQRRVEYRFPFSRQEEEPGPADRPVIIGMGPAGLFCGHMLALHGFRPIILERGEDVEKREAEVKRFWRTGVLNPESNVQFGEGGAGTFSDGKLNTLVKDKDGRGRAVLSALVEAGASERILYDYMPHIGTDILKKVVKRMRQTIMEHGGEVRFGQKVTSFLMEAGSITGVMINENEKLEASRVVLAIGHSARDTFQVLHDVQIPMEAKAFAVGLRVEHPQAMINLSQYGQEEHEILEAAAYKLVSKETRPSVYSFCMCPGGFVVNASSEAGRIAVNGMSYSDRTGSNANSAIVMAVTPEDYGGEGALAGIEFQRRLEEKAFEIGGGKIPVEYFKEFKDFVLGQENQSKVDKSASTFQPAIKGEWCFAPVHKILPAALIQAFVKGMTEFGRQIQGFDGDDVLISGVESRTSSPVRILRDDSLQSAVQGLFPCGEGAGYAGGIMSAAMDGIKVAEAVALSIQNP